MFDIVEILQNNWTLFLIGQYPHGPLGGLASTLILAALALLRFSQNLLTTKQKIVKAFSFLLP